MLPKSERAAIIDIGSNSVRLVIYSVLGASILPTFNEKVMAGLGEGLMKTGQLSPTGVESALRALGRYKAILKKSIGIDCGVELAAPGELAPLTQTEVRQKPIRLIDERFK